MVVLKTRHCFPFVAMTDNQFGSKFPDFTHQKNLFTQKACKGLLLMWKKKVHSFVFLRELPSLINCLK